MTIRSIITVLSILLSTSISRADIPSFDVASFKYNGELYYGVYFPYSNLNTDTQSYAQSYYRDSCSASDLFKQLFQMGNIEVFKHQVAIPTEKLYSNDYYNFEGEFLYYHYNKIENIDFDSTLVSEIYARKGNTGGYTFTPTLSILDAHWINDYPLQNILKFSDGEICDMDLFAIEGNLSTNEIRVIQNRIVNAVNRRKHSSKDYYNYTNNETLDDIIKELHKRYIIMVGFCSC